MIPAARSIVVASIVAASTIVVACKTDPQPAKKDTPATPSAKPSASSTDVMPLTDDEVRAIVNPSNAPEYAGPTGVIEGTVRVTGGAPTKIAVVTPKGCERARAIVEPSYRAGPDGTLADALVAVIGVAGYVRPARGDRNVTIADCAIDPTVIDLSIGQRLMVSSIDPDQTYMPHVVANAPMQRIVMKDMAPVPVFITKPGIYQMAWFPDVGVAYPTALVFALPNALHAVTRIDGKFRIGGVPVGPAHLTVAHAGMNEAASDVEVKAGEVITVDLTMHAPSSASASASGASSSASLPPRPSIH